MYLCFCKGQDLQNYFAECAYSKCESEAEGAINFGVSFAKVWVHTRPICLGHSNFAVDMGIVIAPPKRPSVRVSLDTTTQTINSPPTSN